MQEICVCYFDLIVRNLKTKYGSTQVLSKLSAEYRLFQVYISKNEFILILSANFSWDLAGKFVVYIVPTWILLVLTELVLIFWLGKQA